MEREISGAKTNPFRARGLLRWGGIAGAGIAAIDVAKAMSVKKERKDRKRENSQLHGGNTHRDDCGRHARYQKQDQTHFYVFAGYILQCCQGTNRVIQKLINSSEAVESIQHQWLFKSDFEERE
jgi:hypothetical protein